MKLFPLLQLFLCLNLHLIRCDNVAEETRTLSDETLDPSEWNLGEDAVLSKSDYDELLHAVSDALGIDANDVHTRLMQESNGSDPSPLLLQLRDELQLNSEPVETEPCMAVDEDDADIVEELDPEEDAVSEAGETVDETIFSEPSALLDDEVDPSESTEETTSTLNAGEESDGSNKDASQSRLSDSSEGVAVAVDSSSTAPVKSKFQENWDIYKKEIADQVKSDLRRVQSVVALVVPPWLRLVLLQIVTKAWMVVHVGTRAASRALKKGLTSLILLSEQ